MFGLDNPSGVSVMPPVTPASNPTPLWFTEGGAGLAVSYPGQEWFNIVQAELLAVLQEASIKPDKSKLNQLAVAIKSIAAERGIELTDKLGNSSTLAASQKLVTEINDNANNKLAKNQNGADIPDKNAFVKNLGLAETVNLANNAVPSSRKVNGKALTGDVSLSAGDVGACRAYSGSIYIGGGGMWTTAEFLQWLKTQGAFDNPYWMCKGSWSYANNRIINDTGCGNICLAGAVVEVMGVESAMTIRVTTPTTTVNDGIPNAQFTYINHGKDYRPGWRRDYNTANPDNIVPVGVPLPYPHRYTPAGYLTCNGQTFDKSLYPKLAEAYPSGRVPDLRGEFIRGWDDSRGVDPGRVCGTWQPQQVQWHQHLGGHGGRAQGQFGVTSRAEYPGSYHDDGKQTLPFTNNGSDYQGFTNNGAVGAETRPRNIAFNYIVRAA
ncbi:tail fiber protein [Photorhabdus bodei]|uniref:Tail fiber protein n=1 Tax=Photorhabdus bodei TaxID=2029681 RepID=A0AAW6BLW7_9GAMM|nr:tail fiber protein [Photorhabdus bodei]MDB6374447.1 tail fiber protein [Photorhabdus bodei]